MNTELLWFELNGRLRSFIARRVKQADDVEDLLQEAFLRLHSKPPPKTGNLAGWVFRVVRNLINDYHRSQRLGSDVTADACADYERFEVSESEQVAAGWLRSMAEELPEKYRQAVVLADFEGRSMKQVAEELGLSVSGAKSRVQRGRKQITTALWDCCTFQFDKQGRVTTWQRRDKDCACC